MSTLYSIQVGRQAFDYTDPYAHRPILREAVAAISKVNRFGGHTVEAYNVAQHSVVVSVLAEKQGAAWSGLAHDLAEAYYGDLPSPLKWLIRDTCPMLAARLKTIDAWIEDAFLFDPRIDSVKRADRIALATERRDLLPSSSEVDGLWDAARLPAPSHYVISPLTPKEAEKAWWRRYYQLRDAGKAPKFDLADCYPRE